jgi:hypothetical protein
LVRRIKVAQKRARVGDAEYRALLGGYGVESCKDLDFSGATAVIRFLESMRAHVAPERGARRLKYEDLGKRRGMASPKQLRMLEAIWAEVSVQPTAAKRHAAWLVFLRNRFDRVAVEHIESELVGKIKRALEAMRVQRERD